jgi:hypothetical protein
MVTRSASTVNLASRAGKSKKHALGASYRQRLYVAIEQGSMVRDAYPPDTLG